MKRYVVFSLLIAMSSSALGDEPRMLPSWLAKHISDQKDKKYPDEVEEVSYKGSRAFELVRTDRYDTGDEHVLYNVNGNEICKFGGYKGRVTSGMCDIDQINYVRTLTQRKPYVP